MGPILAILLINPYLIFELYTSSTQVQGVLYDLLHWKWFFIFI